MQYWSSFTIQTIHVWRNIEALLRNQFRRGKAIIIKYSEPVFNLSYAARKEHAPYYTAISGLSVFAIIFLMAL